MKEPRVWSKDGVGHIEVPRPDEVIKCLGCQHPMEWRWTLESGPAIADWWAFCDNRDCKRGPTIIESLSDMDA